VSAGLATVTFADLIFHHALARPEKPAIVLADRVVTYDMIAQGILRAQDRVAVLGLERGAPVCVALDSPIRQMIVGAALFRLGHPVIPVAHPDDVLPLQLPVGDFLHGPGVSLPPGFRQAVVDDSWFAGERRVMAASPPQGFVDEQAVCLIALSSGTTGRPKAISLNVKAFQQWIINYYSTLGLGGWDRLLCLVGLNSSWGFSLAAHALFAGRTLLFARSAARDSLQMISVYGVDAMVATSQQLRELVREQAMSPVPCLSLRTVLTGGGLLSRSLIADARASLCSGIVVLYGSSEAGGTAFAMGDRLLEAEGATGYVAPWAQVEIVDDDDRILPAGTDGILRIRATCQGAPYPPERASENDSFRGGWFYPGDRGRIAADGMMILSGRTSDIINVGGLKFAPEGIEDILRGHPSVIEVAAFGAMSGGGIEEVSLAIVARTPVADRELIEWSAQRGVPVARVFQLETLPKTPSGKIHRDLLKRRLLGSGKA